MRDSIRTITESMEVRMKEGEACVLWHSTRGTRKIRLNQDQWGTLVDASGAAIEYLRAKSTETAR